jgi:hypothetical protein
MSIPDPRLFFFGEWRELESSSPGKVMTGLKQSPLAVVSAAASSHLSSRRDRMGNDHSCDSFRD